ncbi:hypothetical protein NRIC_19900 [Enterococcus florum]|uniref:Uncharacterized protein n=2 Tax=Enterococcus florum TaxID=2480627 RepID=A0A4V0WPJ7_9ENTE|nr:hypothetical protein NRIC_19900 [Enterococcus florum]
MLLMNRYTPLMYDDYSYSVKTQSFFSIFKDEYHQYMTWTGRSVVHVILRFFAKLPKPFFNVYNAAMFTILFYQMLLLTKMKKIDDINHLAFFKVLTIFATIWLFIPTFSDVFLWMAGSVNYLTAMVIMLSFILGYHHYMFSKNKKRGTPTKVIGFFLLGLLAGWCNENTSGGTLVIVCGYVLIALLFQKRKIQLWMISGILGNVIGLTFMVIAPGNDIRATYFDRNNLSFLGKILDALPIISGGLKDHISMLLFFTIVLIGYLYWSEGTTPQFMISLLFFIGGILTVGVLLISPAGIVWSRSYFGGIVFILISFYITLFHLVTRAKETDKLLTAIVSGYILTFFLFSFTGELSNIYKNHLAINRQTEEIKMKIKAGEKDLVIEPLKYKVESNYVASDENDISPDKDSGRNKNVATYLGVRSIRIK